MKRGILIFVIALMFACGNNQNNQETTPDSIGAATMTDDRVIQLQLRAEGPGGLVGDGFFSYPPDHPRYQEILDHVGGLNPGESKPVPPFPDED